MTDNVEKETSIFVRPKACKFNAADLPIIQNLVALGYDALEIGMILGYSGKALDGWKISAGKTLGQDAKDAVENGLSIADAMMIKELVREAFGYDWEEVTEDFKYVTDYDRDTGEVISKKVKIGEKRRNRRQPGNARLAELLATNRLPEIMKKVSEIRKSSLEAKAELTTDQVDQLIGRLLEKTQNLKHIDSKTIETE
jgi:hypothetical protein